MFRAFIELVLIIAVVLVARAVLTSILRGVARAANQSIRQETPGPQTYSPSSGGELHKDPVCGTYVAENAALKRQSGGQTFYYCSQACFEKHWLVAH